MTRARTRIRDKRPARGLDAPQYAEAAPPATPDAEHPKRVSGPGMTNPAVSQTGPGEYQPVSSPIGMGHSGDRDIPGGLHHLVQEVTEPTKPAAPRPDEVLPYFRGSMAHGVPGQSDVRVRPDDQLTPGHPARKHGSQRVVHELPSPEPDPLPVYVVERGQDRTRKERRMFTYVLTVAAAGGEPTRVASEDSGRVELRFFNEGAIGPTTAPAQPAVPASTVAQQNTNAYPVTVTLSGFTLTAVVVNGITVGAANGPYVVPAYGSISVTYTVVGTWVWANAAPGGAVIRLAGSQAALAGVSATAPGDGVAAVPQQWSPPVLAKGDLWAVTQGTTTALLSVMTTTEVND